MGDSRHFKGTALKILHLNFIYIIVGTIDCRPDPWFQKEACDASHVIVDVGPEARMEPRLCSTLIVRKFGKKVVIMSRRHRCSRVTGQRK